MITAIVGIAGVVLGGLLNVLGGYLLALRRERREIRTAARLLLPELLHNASSLETAETLKRWAFVEFKFRRWNECQTQLASGLGDEWRYLTAVYTAFELLTADREWRSADELLDDDLDDGDDIEYILLTRKEIERALDVLWPLTALPRNIQLRVPEIYGV